MFWVPYVVVAIFLANLLFYLIMSFKSPYMQKLNAEGPGKVFNIIWLTIIVLVFAALSFFYTTCVSDMSLNAKKMKKFKSSGSGSSTSPERSLEDILSALTSCDVAVYLIVAALIAITIPIMTWIVIADRRYKARLAQENKTSQEAKK